MDDAVKKYRMRRNQRLGRKTEFDDNPVALYYERRYNRTKARFDADEEEGSNNNGGGSHGNTRIPFGLCQREGIRIEAGWTPEDAWNALEGKGYKPGEVYSELKETGKVPSKSAVKAEKPKMDMKQAESVIKGYKKQENAITKLRREIDGELHRELFEKRWEADALKSKGKAIQEQITQSKLKYPSLESLDEETRNKVKEDRKKLEAEQWEIIDKSKKAEAEVEEVRKKREDARIQLHEEREKLKGRRKEYHEAVKTKYPTYNDCKDKKELLERFNANDFYREGAAYKTDFGRLDMKSARLLAEDCDAFFEKNPKLAGKLGTFIVRSLRSYGGVSYDDHVEFDLGNFNGMANRRHFRKGMHPETDDWCRQAVFHEYTHQLDDYMSAKMKLRRNGFSQKVYDEVVDRLKKDGDELVTGLEDKIPARIKGPDREKFLNDLIKQRVKSSVSEYAYRSGRKVHEHNAEFIAEAYSGYLDNKNPSKVEKLVGEIVTRYIDEMED